MTEVKRKQAEKDLKKYQEYSDFVMFVATPKSLRGKELGVGNQNDFCKKYKVNKGTLSKWEKLPGFWQEVSVIRNGFFKNRCSDVLLSLEQKCLNQKTVNGSDVKVYLSAIGEYQEKQQQINAFDPEIEKALQKLNSIIPD